MVSWFWLRSRHAAEGVARFPFAYELLWRDQRILELRPARGKSDFLELAGEAQVAALGFAINLSRESRRGVCGAVNQGGNRKYSDDREGTLKDGYVEK